MASSRPRMRADDVAADQRRRLLGRVDDRDVVPALGEEVGHRQRRDVVVLRDDQHAVAGGDPAGEDVADVEHVRGVGAGDVRAARSGAGGDGDGVRAVGEDVVRRGALAAVDVDAEVVQAPLLPAQVRRVPLVPRRLDGVAQLSAELGVGLPEVHVQPALAGERGELHARGAAADDEQPAAARHRGPRHVDLVAGRRVDRAAEGQALHVPAADALVAADAGADVRGAAVPGLDQQVAVGDVRAGHADDVGLRRRRGRARRRRDR